MLEVVGSKARTGRAQRGSMDRSSSSSLAKESERDLDRKAPQCGQKDVPGRRMDAKETLRYWLVGCQACQMKGRHRKAQALPLSRIARSKAGYSGVLEKAGAKGENVEERMEVAKRSRTLSVKANGIEATSG